MLNSATVVVPIVPRKSFTTDDSFEVMRFAAESFDTGHGVALATLVEIRGGSARSLGSHMAIRDDGLYCGFVSGGCTETAVASEAVEAISKGCDRNLLLGEGSPFFDIVLPCGGGITIAIHVVRDSAPLHAVLCRLGSRQPASLCYEPAMQRLSAAEAAKKTGWNGEAFIIHHRPRVRVLLAGRSIEVEVIGKVAAAVGYDVQCHDGRATKLAPETIDADTAVALLYHDIDLEIPVFEMALRSNPFYIGALGSLRTHDRRVQRMEELGYSETEIAKIKSPIGLFNKARDSQSLALSILADIAACRLSHVR
jgi:xanthine dehydrogenase accessory factor